MQRWGDRGNRLSMADHLEIRRRVTAGDSFAVAAAAVGCSTKSIQRLLRGTGGLPVRTHTRSAWRLSLAEREEVSRGLLAGASLRAVAARLGRSPSTITREVSANGGREAYRACLAEQSAATRARRPKLAKLAARPDLRHAVGRGLRARWSPQQIAARLRTDYLATRGCAYRTRRSIARCSCRRAGRCGRNWWRACGRAARSAAHTSAPTS